MTPRISTAQASTSSRVTPLQVGLYARISDDPNDTELGVQRQLKDGSAAAAKRGATSVTQYVDNDISATRSKVRPGFQRLLADIRARRIDAIICYDLDRLTRSPRETEDLIDLCRAYGVKLWPLTGDIDLDEADGMLQMRIKGAISRHSTDQMSRRLKRKLLEKAETGQPHSPVAYGYRRVVVRDSNDRRLSSRDELNEYEAHVLQWAAERVLAGMSLRAITAQLNHPTDADALALNGGQPVAPPRQATTWTSQALRNMLLRERNAGRRIHNGRVLGPAAWPVLYSRPDGSPDPDLHDRVVAVLTDPARTVANYQGSTRKHLLSGLLICGVCGGTDVRLRSKGPHRSSGTSVAYGCVDGHVSRRQSDLDELVRWTMIAWLEDPQALDRLATGNSDELEAAHRELAVCRAKLKRAVAAFSDGDDDEEDIDALNQLRARLRPRIEAAKAIIAANMPSNVPTELAGDTATEKWDNAPLDVKRVLLRQVVRITVLRTTSGRKPFNPDSIRFEWTV